MERARSTSLLRRGFLTALLAVSLTGCAGIGTTPVAAPPPATAAAPGGVVAGGVVGYGDTASGTITRPGQRDEFRVDLAAGDAFLITDMTGGDINLRVEVTSLVDGTAARGGDPGIGFAVYEDTPLAAYFQAVRDGGYRIVVATGPGSDFKGAYSFRVVRVTVHNRAATIGQTLSGSLDVPGAIDRYTLDTDSARAIRIEFPGTSQYSCGDVHGSLHAESTPLGGFFGLNHWCTGELTLTPGTRYVLDVFDPRGRPVHYTLRIIPA